MTLVSVYITNYNYEKYLTQAIESVLFQTYKNIELIIIDDGSQDRSKLIIESYADYPNIKIIFQKNKGLNVTNNIAMKVANGKYIMRLDADDYLVDTAIEEMVSLLEADENLGLVFPDYYLVDVDNTKTAEIQRFDFDTEVSLFDLPAHGACTMIRLDFLKRLGGYDESYTCQDGYELWIKFVTKYRVTNISKPLFYYRQHGENLTSNEDKILNTRIKIKKDFLYKNKIQTPETLAIIPIRNTKIGNKYLAFTKIGNERIIDIKIRTVLESDLVSKVVVTSHNQEFLDYINKEYFGNVRVVTVLRPMSFARLNESLNNTINLVLANPKCLIDEKGGFVVLPLEYPFLNSNEIDDTIRTSVIFKADTVISV